VDPSVELRELLRQIEATAAAGAPPHDAPVGHSATPQTAAYPAPNSPTNIATYLFGVILVAGSVAGGWLLLADQADATRAPAVADRNTSAPAPAPPRLTLSVPTINATAGDRVRVPVRIGPPSLATEAATLEVHGLPADARFVRGVLASADRWIIPAPDLDELELAVGGSVEGRFDLVAELHSVDGRPLAIARSLLVVASSPTLTGSTTAAAVSEAPATIAPTGFSNTDALDEASQIRFLNQGMRFLTIGNINSARLLFERAAEGGNARAALLLGDTFDSTRLARLGVLGVLPDRAKSIYWYERADELGAPEAKERLSEINLR